MVPKLNLQNFSKLSSDLSKKKHVKNLSHDFSNHKQLQMYFGAKTIPSKQIKIIRQQNTQRDTISI
jgi:hypothetical protein